MSACGLRRAWVLNFDAEFELECGPRYTPTENMRARSVELARRFRSTLPPTDIVIAPALDSCPVDRQSSEPRFRGVAWCPTPRALYALQRAELPLPPAPSFETLRRVHDREFAWRLAGDELGSVLRGTTLEEIEAHVASPGPTGEWLLKRAFGVAGRGQRPLHAGKLTAPDRAWIVASLRRAPLYVEPRVHITRELSVHAWAREHTEIRSIRQARVGPNRAWIDSERASSLDAALEHALVSTGERVGAALIAAGYHGPFGIDAYEWRTSTGTTALRALSEINPRYCMGWDADDDWG